MIIKIFADHIPLLLFLMSWTHKSNAGIVHSHTKEHESDGPSSPINRGHYSESGEHFSEFDHEAIIGSQKDAEEYDHLPPEEAKKRLGILLEKMDLNGDRKIDRRELKAWIIRSFKMLSEEEAADRMEDIDEDNDGMVTWNEYAVDTYGIGEENVVNFGNDNEHLIEDDKIMWIAADANGDGVLNTLEWVSFSHPEEHPDMLPVILKQTLKEKDKDEDGSISFQEYIGDRGGDLGKESLIMEKVKFDDVLDKNHDGKLDGNEILSWVVPSNEEIAAEEVDHLFAQSDDNHDDILDFEEILEHHETFVGSEVTDYGDHLHNIHHFDDEL